MSRTGHQFFIKLWSKKALVAEQRCVSPSLILLQQAAYAGGGRSISNMLHISRNPNICFYWVTVDIERDVDCLNHSFTLIYFKILYFCNNFIFRSKNNSSIENIASLMLLVLDHFSRHATRRMNKVGNYFFNPRQLKKATKI